MVLRGRKARDETVTVDGSLHEAAKSYVCASHWSPSWQQCNAVVSSPYGSLILRRPRLFCPTCEASAQSIAAFPREDGSPALVQFGAALGAAPSASAAWRAFARPVAFAECGAVPSAVFARRCSFSRWLADVLFPAAAGASGDPASARQLACPVVVDISCRWQRCRCLAA